MQSVCTLDEALSSEEVPVTVVGLILDTTLFPALASKSGLDTFRLRLCDALTETPDSDHCHRGLFVERIGLFLRGVFLSLRSVPGTVRSDPPPRSWDLVVARNVRWVRRAVVGPKSLAAAGAAIDCVLLNGEVCDATDELVLPHEVGAVRSLRDFRRKLVGHGMVTVPPQGPFRPRRLALLLPSPSRRVEVPSFPNSLFDLQRVTDGGWVFVAAAKIVLGAENGNGETHVLLWDGCGATVPAMARGAVLCSILREAHAFTQGWVCVTKGFWHRSSFHAAVEFELTVFEAAAIAPDSDAVKDRLDHFRACYFDEREPVTLLWPSSSGTWGWQDRVWLCPKCCRGRFFPGYACCGRRFEVEHDVIRQEQ